MHVRRRALSCLGALALTSALVHCGARTDLELGAEAHAGATSSSDAGAAGTRPSIDPAVCAAFFPRWHQRAEDTTADCEYCLVYGACNWPNLTACGAGTGCVANLCTTVKTAEALCSCIESCIALESPSCERHW